MIYKAPALSYNEQQPPASMRCPACRQQGIFGGAPGLRDGVTGNWRFGQRLCPNPECRAHVFVVFEGRMLALSYPAERIDFDSTGIPAPIVEALEEAITCAANQCYVAAAIMVRKTLEELCKDRGATGPNLKARIKALGGRVVLPEELLDAMDDLRLLGNDAAHIESTEYNDVGQDEVEVGVLLAKEVLKAVYQYSSLLGQLRALKRPAGTAQ